MSGPSPELLAEAATEHSAAVYVELQAMTRRAEQAEAALERVRALHRNEYGCCTECTEVHSALWPCNTIAAIDQTEEAS